MIVTMLRKNYRLSPESLGNGGDSHSLLFMEKKRKEKALPQEN